MTDPDFLDAKIISNVAFGDLEGDGQDDAVAVLGTSGGGTGYFPELHVFLGDKPPHSKFVDKAFADLGDRVDVQSVHIESRQIVVSAAVHRPSDGLCFPKVKTVQRYTFDGKTLLQTDGMKDYQ